MKTNLQLSIEADLKQRLMHFSEQTGIPMSRVISDMLQKYLPEEEKKHNIQPLLETITFPSRPGRKIV